jgi:hypothetical protein
MSLYEKSSVVMLPHGYAQNKIFNIKPMAGTADFGFTKTSSGTRFNKQGFLERMPWSQFLGSNTDAPGNLSKTNCTATIADAIDGNGQMTADTFRETTANSVHGYLAQFNKDSLSKDYRFDVWVKPDGRNWIALMIADTTAFNNSIIQHYDISSGIVGSLITNGTGFTLVSALIEPGDNGYYKCSLVVNTSNASTGAASLLMAAADKVYSYIGDSSKGIKWWKYQFYEGAEEKPFQAVSTSIVNFPTLDYLNSSCPSLLLTPAKSNYSLQSQNLAHATWTKLRVSVTPNAAIGVDGLMNAARVVLTDVSATTRLTNPSASLPATVGPVCFSVYIKKDSVYNSPTFQLCMSVPGGTDKEVYFSSTTFQPTGLATGAATLVSSGSQEILDGNGVSTGWWRCWIACTGSSGSGWTGFLEFFDGGGSQVGDSLLIDKTQIETGVYPTVYIHTTSAGISRGADSITPIVNPDLIGQTEGSIFIHVSIPELATADKCLSISDGTTNNRVLIQFLTSGIIRGFISLAGVTQADISVTPYVVNTFYKVIFTYQNNKAALFVNGVKVGEDLTVNVPACNQIRFDRGDGIQPLFGNVKAYCLLKTALTDLEAITETTP